MTARPSELRSSSIRVALATTGIIAVAYLVIGFAVVAIVNGGLTTEIDRRLAASLQSLVHEPPPDEHGYGPPHDGPRFGPSLLVWTVRPDGTVAASETGADLPSGYSEVTQPTTVTIGEDEFRIQGARTENGYVVVGQTTAEVTRARTTLILAEIVIAPILLIVVFLGAVAIGRRVAAPVEQARVRRLEFTADASHELRMPLSVIEAHTSLALAEDRDAAWYRNAFTKIAVENRRMRRLVEDLLWLARFDATKESHATDPVDLGVLAADTVDRFRVVAEARGLSLRLAVEPGDHSVAVPAEWLDRLLGVLLDNAAKYAPAGSEVVVSVAADSGRIRLTVDDAGSGIPEEERTRIFDRFHRATDSRSGAGLRPGHRRYDRPGDRGTLAGRRLGRRWRQHVGRLATRTRIAETRRNRLGTGRRAAERRRANGCIASSALLESPPRATDCHGSATICVRGLGGRDDPRTPAGDRPGSHRPGGSRLWEQLD